MPALALPSLGTRRAWERAALTRLQLAHEHALQAHLVRALRSIGQEAAKAYRQHGSIQAVTIRNQLARVLRPSLVSTARAFKDRLISHPKAAHGFEAKAFDDLDAAIAEYMAEHTAEAVVGISETTRTAIVNAIENGQDDGLAVEQIAQAIVEATSGEIGIARARRIALTETHSAAMYGQFAAAEASPIAFNKVWLATEDDRTRPEHAAANDQMVPLDQPFDVDGHPMMYPGEPGAPAYLVINCRCVCTFEPVPASGD